MNKTKEVETEDMRWRKTIIKYKSEIHNSMQATNRIIEKGYVTQEDDIVKITDKGIGFIEAKLDSAKIPEKQLDAFNTYIDSLFELDELELDIMVCTAIYKHDYKNEPSVNSLSILRKLLSDDGCVKTSACPK